MSGDRTQDLYMYDIIRELPFAWGDVFGWWTIMWIMLVCGLFVRIKMLARRDSDQETKSPMVEEDEIDTHHTKSPPAYTPQYLSDELDHLENAIGELPQHERYRQYQSLMRNVVGVVYDIDILSATYDDIYQSDMPTDIKHALSATYTVPYAGYGVDEMSDIPDIHMDMHSYIDIGKNALASFSHADA